MNWTFLGVFFTFLARYVLGDNRFPRIVVGKDYSGLYYVNTTFGTPGQEQSLRVDIAQPYTWLVSGAIYPQCNKVGSGCTTGSLYYPLESTSGEVIDSSLVTYNFIDTISINGTTHRDIMNFTNIVSLDNAGVINETYVYWDMSGDELLVSNFSFVLANETGSLVTGAVGLGGPISGPASEAISESNFDDSFYFLSFLKDAGVINSTSFSLWIDDPYVNSTQIETNPDVGRLLLGAVDSSLFEGDLVAFQAIPLNDYQTGSVSSGYPIVPLTKVSIENSDKESVSLTDSDLLLPVFIDSRFTYSYLPLTLIIQIAIQTGAVYVSSLDRWVVACDVGDLDSLVLFQFGNLSISVPTSDFLATTYNTVSNSTLRFSDGQQACFLKVYPNYVTSFSILGQSFFKNSYFVHDLEGGNIAMAQAATNVNTKRISNSSISAISSGSIPFASSSNITQDLTLTYYKTNTALSTDVLNQFTASVRSDGEIFTGRSYYVTSKTSVASSASTTSSSASSLASSKAVALQLKNPLSTPNLSGGLLLAFFVYTLLGFFLLF